jgi:hypothetical protein
MNQNDSANAFERPVSVLFFSDFKKDILTVQIAKGLPPGARINFNLNNSVFRGKIIAIKKIEQNRVEAAVKLYSTTKEQKKLLLNKTNNARHV